MAHDQCRAFPGVIRSQQSEDARPRCSDAHHVLDRDLPRARHIRDGERGRHVAGDWQILPPRFVDDRGVRGGRQIVVNLDEVGARMLRVRHRFSRLARRGHFHGIGKKRRGTIDDRARHDHKRTEELSALNFVAPPIQLGRSFHAQLQSNMFVLQPGRLQDFERGAVRPFERLAGGLQGLPALLLFLREFHQRGSLGDRHAGAKAPERCDPGRHDT